MKEGKKIAVLFDTNSYRNLVTGKNTNDVLLEIHKIKAAEKEKNITAIGIMVVAMEMLGNLAEGPTGFNYNDCLNGLLAMTHHCIEESTQRPRFIPHAYLHLTKAFFSEVPKEMENLVQNMIGVANDLRIDLQQSLAIHESKGTFEQIKNYLDAEEAKFSTEIVALIDAARAVVKKKKPNITKKQERVELLKLLNSGLFEPEIALAMILAVYATLSQELSADGLHDRARSLQKEFPLSVGFHRWVCYTLVDKNIDMQSKISKRKRWNWQWDYHVSFLINGHKLSGMDVLLVTNDTDLTQMISDFGYEQKVMTIGEYLKFIGLAN
jgi:hypothetical protein